MIHYILLHIRTNFIIRLERGARGAFVGTVPEPTQTACHHSNAMVMYSKNMRPKCASLSQFFLRCVCVIPNAARRNQSNAKWWTICAQVKAFNLITLSLGSASSMLVRRVQVRQWPVHSSLRSVQRTHRLCGRIRWEAVQSKRLVLHSGPKATTWSHSIIVTFFVHHTRFRILWYWHFRSSKFMVSRRECTFSFETNHSSNRQMMIFKCAQEKQIRCFDFSLATLPFWFGQPFISCPYSPMWMVVVDDDVVQCKAIIIEP